MRARPLIGGVVMAVVVGLVAALGPAVPWASQDDSALAVERAPLVDPAEATGSSGATPLVAADEPSTTTVAPVTTTTAPATTTTAAPTTTTTVPAQRFTLEPYRGLGAWLDVYDWTSTHARYAPALEANAIDTLAAQGVQTLFIQASKWDAPGDVLEPERLMGFIERAHHHGISVVGWYLPTLEDPHRDIQRILAIAALPVDGIAIDIEARNVGDVAERNRRLIAVSNHIRKALPGEVIGAIPLEPVLLEDVNPSYWPGFPWAELAPHYDVWLPMGYWTNRRGGWRDARNYTIHNIDRLRARIGQPGAHVHALGGIGDATTVEDLKAFWQAASERKVIGGSIYDFRTTAAPFWPELLPFASLRG